MSLFMMLLLVGTAFGLAYSNGANDNFKGVATLYGSGTLSYRKALTLSTLATLAGSLASVFLAASLIKAFSGKGLVPENLIGSGELLLAVGGAAAITVFLATLLGMPTSTTHALTGGLLGVGLVLGAGNIQFGKLWGTFLMPLMISPVLAILGAVTIYPLLHKARLWMGITSESCVCLNEEKSLSLAGPANELILPQTTPVLVVGTEQQCAERYSGRLLGTDAQGMVNGLHILSGAAVCFARALNDTPKIAALLFLAGGSADPSWKLIIVMAAMALGGVMQSRKVAETMGKRITGLNTGQGLTANLLTAGLVMGASHMGVPVSTTHVSCGTLFGIGAAQKKGNWKTILQIVMAWVTTLPFAAILSAGAISILM